MTHSINIIKPRVLWEQMYTRILQIISVRETIESNTQNMLYQSVSNEEKLIVRYY